MYSDLNHAVNVLHGVLAWRSVDDGGVEEGDVERRQSALGYPSELSPVPVEPLIRVRRVISRRKPRLARGLGGRQVQAFQPIVAQSSEDMIEHRLISKEGVAFE